MINLKKIHIHYSDKKGVHHIRVIQPSDPKSIDDIKMDIADVLYTLQGKAEYYYVVLEVTKGRQKAYRTIIPKTMLI